MSSNRINGFKYSIQPGISARTVSEDSYTLACVEDLIGRGVKVQVLDARYGTTKEFVLNHTELSLLTAALGAYNNHRASVHEL